MGIYGSSCCLSSAYLANTEVSLAKSTMHSLIRLQIYPICGNVSSTPICQIIACGNDRHMCTLIESGAAWVCGISHQRSSTPPTRMAEHRDESATSDDNVTLEMPGEKRTTSSARQPLTGTLTRASRTKERLETAVREWSLLERRYGEHSLRRPQAVRESDYGDIEASRKRIKTKGSFDAIYWAGHVAYDVFLA